MKIISKPRGTGKSSHLAELSEIHHIPIIEPTASTKEACKKKFPNAIFITYDEYCNMTNKPKEIFIDDFPEVLKNKIFAESHILEMTYSPETTLTFNVKYDII